MNPGTFAGPGTGVPYGSISRYIQTPTITSSRTIAVPPGTQRIEALLCGGGGGGGATSGGFGGCAIIQIPITGSPLSVVIGTGGGVNAAGSPTYVVSAGTRYAEVGGGGSGANDLTSHGRSGGGGGGGGGCGGGPPIGNLLWSIYPQGPIGQIAISNGYGTVNNVYGGCATGNSVSSSAQIHGGCGSFGAGGGTNSSNWDGSTGYIGTAGYGAGGTIAYTYSSFGVSGNFGGGGSNGGNYGGGGGGSLTSVSVWGYTGFAGGGGGGYYGGGGGGGGMLGAGTSGVYYSSAGNGGNGGGGAGGGNGNGGSYGVGGNGFAAIRFYL